MDYDVITCYVFSSNLTEYGSLKADNISYVGDINAPLIGNNSTKPLMLIISILKESRTGLIVFSFDNTQLSNTGIHIRGHWYVFADDFLLN